MGASAAGVSAGDDAEDSVEPPGDHDELLLDGEDSPPEAVATVTTSGSNTESEGTLISSAVENTVATTTSSRECGTAVISLIEDDCIADASEGEVPVDDRPYSPQKHRRTSKRLRRNGDEAAGTRDLPPAVAEGLVDSEDEDDIEVVSPLRRKRRGGSDGESSDDGEEWCEEHDAHSDEDDDEDIFFSRRTLATKKKSSRGDTKKCPQDVSSPGGGSDWRGILDYGQTKTSKGGKRKKKSQSDRISEKPTHNALSHSKPVGQKILVFAHHAEVMDAIESCLRKLEVGFIRIDGHVSVSSRSALISKFQNDNEVFRVNYFHFVEAYLLIDF